MRDQLLDAAARVLQAEGPTAVTTRRIATAAACSEGSIYNHFATKEELVVAAVVERVARFPDLLAELDDAPAGTGVEERLRELAGEAQDFYARIAPLISGGVRDPLELHARTRRIHEAGYGPWRTVERIAAWLERERGRGRVSAGADVTAAATALLGACMFHALTAHAWGPEIAPPAEVAADRAVAAVWHGLAPAAGS